MVLTGTRAEYGLLKPVMDAILKHPQLELSVLVTGMHLEKAFGHTIEAIEKDGYPIVARVPMSAPEDTGKGMALSVSKGIAGMSEALTQIQPDCLLLLGDRTEVLAGATAALFMGIPIAHIHGGDVTRGGTDESVRHAVTKMAHLHFPATEAAANRIQKMGEDSWRIQVTGAPGLDTILNFEALDVAEIKATYGVDPEGEGFALLIQHPVSTEPELAQIHIEATLQALENSKFPVLAIHPNSDAGGLAIVEAYQKTNFPGFQSHASLPHEHYLSLLKHCKVLVGNSSSGIIESASFKTPVVNIGMRQEGRDRSANVIDALPEIGSIQAALERAVSSEFASEISNVTNAYGDGQTGKKIAEYLSSAALGKRLIQKKLNYT